MKGRTFLILRTSFSLVLILILVVALSGCTITLLAPYDETTEKEATNLQRQIDAFITTLIYEGGDTPVEPTASARKEWEEKRRAALDYAKFQKEYENINVTLRSLKIRTEAISQNKETTEQIGYIMKNFKMLQDHHMKYSKGEVSSFSNSYLRNARDIINTQFKSLLSLEIAKKRGGKVDSAEINE